jgi:hypothetical protein
MNAGGPRDQAHRRAHAEDAHVTVARHAARVCRDDRERGDDRPRARGGIEIAIPDVGWAHREGRGDDGVAIVIGPAAQGGRLRALAARCGSQVAWARDWADAAERARRNGRLIVVAIHAQPGFALGNALDERVFMAPEVVALMEHRFVGWRWSAGRPAPFVDHDVFGLGGSTFGVGLLVCTPEGEVVRQIYLLDPVLVADALRAALDEHDAPAPPAASRAERAAFLIDSGRIEAARSLLGAPGAAEPRDVAFQRARLHRIERSGRGRAPRDRGGWPRGAVGRRRRPDAGAAARRGSDHPGRDQ